MFVDPPLRAHGGGPGRSPRKLSVFCCFRGLKFIFKIIFYKHLHIILPTFSVGLSSVIFFFLGDVNLAPPKSGARGSCPPFRPLATPLQYGIPNIVAYVEASVIMQNRVSVWTKIGANFTFSHTPNLSIWTCMTPPGELQCFQFLKVEIQLNILIYNLRGEREDRKQWYPHIISILTNLLS